MAPLPSTLAKTSSSTPTKGPTPIIILSDEPQLSSAALCILLHLPSGDVDDSSSHHQFRPEFTHQVIPGEWIRGYQPFRNVLMEEEEKYRASTKNTQLALSRSDEDDSVVVLLHKSHQHHDNNNNNNINNNKSSSSSSLATTKELNICVQLAPSCRNCQVTIQMQKKRKLRQHTRSTSSKKEVKRLKGGGEDFAYNTEDEEESSSKDSRVENEDDDESEFVVSDEDEEDEDEETPGDESHAEGSTRKRRMPESEILECIGKALPDIVGSNVNDNFLDAPLGRVLREFSITKNDNKQDFVMCLANGSDQAVVDYHSQVQKLAIFFIENADNVNIAKTDGGFWKVVYLFQKHSATQFSLAGYVTLFHFHAPFHKPKPGIIVRICQALVLTPYQRQGHGMRLLEYVYELANDKHTKLYYDGDDRKIVQFNVEDPAPGFVALRNKVDLQLFLAHPEWLPPSAGKVAISDDTFFMPLTDAQAQTASANARITPRQVHVVYELFKLKFLKGTALEKDSKEVAEKNFRLMVKKRLNKESREELSSFRTKAEKQAFLTELFDEQLEHYEALLAEKARS
jgi:histone acetyltransferase 1